MAFFLPIQSMRYVPGKVSQTFNVRQLFRCPSCSTMEQTATRSKEVKSIASFNKLLKDHYLKE